MAGSREQSKTMILNSSKDSGSHSLFCSSSLFPGKWFLGIIVLLCVLVGPCQSIRFLGDRETFAKYPKWDACINASIAFEFRTRQKDGLLMYTDDNGKYDYLQVALTDGAIRLWINFVREKEQNVEIELGRNLNDGSWHRVEVKRNRMETTLLVDSNQSSKVSFGSDFRFGEELETNNYMYFGGVPSNYKPNLAQLNIPASVLNTPFNGELRNILYFNCSCLPIRASMLEGRGVDAGHKEACELNNPCPHDCPCMSGNDGSGCECMFKEECIKDLLAHYLLPMDRLDRDLIQNPSGLDSRVYGGPELVKGVYESAIKLDGRSQWIRVSGSSHKGECFGDLDHCLNGYFVGMWIQFQATPAQKGVVMSNGGHLSDGHGIAMSYSQNGLEFIFKTKNGKEWRVEERDVVPGRWYHVAASWAADKGLFLYINGHQVAHDRSPRQTTESRDDTPYKDFVIGRSNDHTGTQQLRTILVDDFIFTSMFKSGDDVREEGSAFHYYMPMDSIQGDKLEADGLEARVHGQVTIVPGKIRQAISFSEHGGYVNLGEASEKCLGDFEKCKHGFYISFFIRFNRLDTDRGYIFSSPYGMNIYQSGSQLVATAQRDRSSWEAQYSGLRPGTWYFVEVSWSPRNGIYLYVDGQEVAHQARESVLRERRPTREFKAFIGRSNEGGRREQLNDVVLDDLDIYYGTRDMLVNTDFVKTGQPNYYHFDFEDVRGNRVVHDKMVIALTGSPDHIHGKVGKALKFDGNNEFADFGDHSSVCFGNLDHCHSGALYSMWIRPDRLKNNMYFLSSGDNGVNLEYRGQKLHATALTSTKQWDVSSAYIDDDKWYFIEVSFHPIRGLGLYINNQLVAEDIKPSSRTTYPSRIPENNRFYLGRGNIDMADSRYAAATFDELDMWYADRDYVSAHGYIQRNRPQHFLIDFEELIDENRLMHPVLSIQLVGRPVLIPGKVDNALELSGRGQYADLGQRPGECFSNLAECKHGITIAAWMRFHSLENNMVFLSTGENGILMMYKDGYIQVSVGGRGVITIPRFENGRWYFIEITWHPETGLELYVNNELRGRSGKTFVASHGRGTFYIGHPNQGDVPAGRHSTGSLDIDEMEIWYGKRDELLAYGYINRDNLGYEEFSLDSADGDRVIHTKYVVLLNNGANIVQGRFNNAVKLNGLGQYVDLGSHFNRCLGNLDLCSHGMTLSIWLNPQQLRNGQTFLSTPTYNIFYNDGLLQSVFHGQQKKWTTSTALLRSEEWQRITMAWHPKKGLTMYINDELVNQDRQGVNEPQRDQPVSEHVYIGRSLDSDRTSSNLLADQFQVWYDDLDQLRATGQYRVEVVPRIIIFDDFRNNVLVIRDREIRGHGDIRIGHGKAQNTRSVYLPGTTGYLDLGANFTCGGDLGSCRQGATFRLGLRPVTLQDGMVFFDSYPVKLYYKDGQLYGQLQTSTHVWTVKTPDFRPGQWQRVELTWHPREGLIMFIDGQRVDYQTYASEQTSQIPSDWRTYFGRALHGGHTYANTYVDNIEFWTAYRDYIPEDDYLKTEIYVTSRPFTPKPGGSEHQNISIIGEIGTITTQNPPYTHEPSTTNVKMIHFNGRSYVQFNFSRLPPEYLRPADKEEFQFHFLSGQPDGLIWLHEDQNRKMYLAMRDGQLIFVNDDRTSSPDEIVIGKRDGVRFDDGIRWHSFRINRRGRRISLSINNAHQEEYIFARDVQFLVPATVYLGGTQNTYSSTDGRVVRNFNGGLAKIFYRTEVTEGNKSFRNEVNLIAEIGDTGVPPNGVEFQTVKWPPAGTGFTAPTPQPPRTTHAPPITPTPPPFTSITIKDERVYLIVPEFLIQTGSSLSFKFQTIKRDGLLMFSTSNIYGKNFIALEIYDGKLYLIHNFGGQSKRTPFSETEVSDGQPHEVEVRFFNNQLILNLDRHSVRVRVDDNEQLPRNLGALHIGGFSTYENLPWHTWARNGYQGCIEDLKINGRVIDLHNYVHTQQLFGGIERRCTSMPQQCSALSPCVHGYCTNKWDGYYCDCRATDYSGDKCQNHAWTGVFNGDVGYKMTFQPQQKYHVDDISFRFKTMVRDGFIFQTKARTDGTFMRSELEGGRIKVTTNLGGEFQTFYTGENLNDMQWHTVYIQRRGNQMAVWVDDLHQQKITLPGDGYHLFVSDVFVAGYRQDETELPPNVNYFTGYLRNFNMGGVDIFQQIDSNVTGIFFQEPYIPPLMFHSVTFPNNDAHVQLSPLGSASGLSIYFLFKSHDPNGVILFSEGRSRELFAVELYDGRLHMKLDIPGKPPIQMTTPENPKFNDGKWHFVSILHQKINGQDQLNLAVDGLHLSNSYSGIDQLNLNGLLFVGGLPDNIFQKQYVREFLSSKTGYRGCLASMTFGRDIPDLYKLGQSSGILNICQDIKTHCRKTTCKNGGVCHDYQNNGTTWCDCSKTAFAGSTCEDEPFGYYFHREGNPELPGMLVYKYGTLEINDNEVDEIILGVMTDEKNAILTKLISTLYGDFIEIKLVNGFPVVTYDTSGQGLSTSITSDVFVSNGGYHVIRFVRTKDNGTLYVDDRSNHNTHFTSHTNFDRLSKIFIGGVYQGGKIVGGTGYRGIIGGLYVNGHLIFPYAEENKRIETVNDVVVAPHPYKLVPPSFTTSGIITSGPVTQSPPIIGIPIIPPDIGGGGIAWVGNVGGISGGGGGGGAGGAGGSGVSVFVFPGGTGGSSVIVPAGLPIVGNTPIAAAQVAVIPPMPASGPRAGAVMGTILGLAALASSLMWAFYRCKPGWCTCLKPPADVPLNIVHRAGSNMAAVNAASASGSSAGAAGGGATRITVANGGQAQGLAAGGGGGGGGNAYYFSQQSSSSGHQRQDSYDSATLRATGTFSNKGTAIGTPKTGRHQIASSTNVGASSTVGGSSSVIGTPSSFQSYHFEGGNSHADYDVASGVHSNYQSNTLTAGGGGAEGGTGAGGGAGGYSTSTMSSNYNYSVKTIQTVGGQQQMLGYAAGSTSNVLVTPGAMGEEIRVDCCLMTGDGHSVVTGSSLGPPQVWNMSNGELLRIMQGETVGSTNLHLVCNDRLLVGAINSDLEINQYSVSKGVHNYVFQIWDFASGMPLGMTQLETCSALTIMSDNDKVVFGRSDKFGGGTNIVVWDLLGNQPIKEMRFDAPVGNNDYISYLNLSQNDRYVIAGFVNTFDNFAEFVVFDMTLTSYNISDPNILRLDASPDCTAILPREEAVTGLRNGDLVVWSVRTGQPTRQLLSNTGKHAHSREVKAVTRSEDNKFLVSASADGTLKVWDLESERHICTMSGHNDEVWCAAISSDNEIVVSGSRDGTIRLWQLRTGKEICYFNAGVDVFYITMSRDKGTIVALGDKFGARKLIMLQVVRSKVKRQVLA